MKNILIPTDFSENAWNAIEYALHFFSKSSCSFYILHVKTPDASADDGVFSMSNGNVVSEAHTKPSKNRLQDTLKRIHKNFPSNANHHFFSIIDNTSIVGSIRNQIEEKKIDFIVMGTKGASKFKKTTIGNNTGNVITKVKCTTLVVPENAKYVKPKEIAFPTDFSFFYPTELLKPITDIIEEHKAAVRIMYFNKNDDVLNEDQQKNQEFLDDYFSGHEHSFHFLTNAHIEDAVQMFVERKNINLITMLAKNLNYFQSILFHPSVLKISYCKDVPFLVLH